LKIEPEHILVDDMVRDLDISRHFIIALPSEQGGCK